jgi:hypothetical protein
MIQFVDDHKDEFAGLAGLNRPGFQAAVLLAASPFDGPIVRA